VTRLRELLADAESRRLRGHVQSAGSGTPRAPSPSGSVLGLSNRAAVQLAAQLLRPGARTSCSLWKARRLLDVGGGGARGVVIVDLAGGAAVLAVVLMVGWLALSNIFGRYK
jgi:hypothetical protein